MTDPVVVVHGGAGIWSGETADVAAACRRASEEGMSAIEGGGSALDAVTAATRILENEPVCNAGTGAVLTSAGTLELDASVMDGATLASGAVACLAPFRNPVDIARAILEDGKYHLLAGEGASRWAIDHGFTPIDPQLMITSARRAEFLAGTSGGIGNTVGAVALDRMEHLAAATSTGGIPGAHPGRVGDSPIVGAGTYAHDRVACSCTGEGEAFARASAAYRLADCPPERLQAGAEELLDLVSRDFGGRGGLIGLTRDGDVAAAWTMPRMPFAIARAGGSVVGGLD